MRASRWSAPECGAKRKADVVEAEKAGRRFPLVGPVVRTQRIAGTSVLG